jgi:4-amino-4-deoxy-L-arabinose transferase-like glycosyltransferase
MLVSSFWWVVAVMAVPAADRPYIGSSQDNSLWNLIFGYNGFGRLTGNENGSVAAGAPGSANRWGITGLTRLFGTEMGSQISWALPAALLLLGVVLTLTLRRHRTDKLRASMVLWGGWLVVTGVVFSLGAGIIHPYYNVALAPAIGAVVGTGAWAVWGRRDRLWARASMAAVALASAVWSYALLDRVPSWHPVLRPLVLGLGAGAALGLVVWPRNGPRWARTLARAGLPALAALAVLVGPASYSVATAATPHTGAIPTAGPSGAGQARGGPGGTGFGGGGFGRGGAGGFFGRGPAGPGASRTSAGNGGFPGGGFPGGSFSGGGFPGGAPSGATVRAPGSSGSTGSTGSTGTGSSGGFAGRRFGGGFGGGGGFAGGGGFGGGGGLLNASTPSKAITEALRSDASTYTWAAAAVGADVASGYQLASGEPIMAIGGFNGTDPTPTLAQFEKYVSEDKIHYFIASGGFGFGSSGSSDASQIASWVEDNYTATTIGGVTVYDLATTGK